MLGDAEAQSVARATCIPESPWPVMVKAVDTLTVILVGVMTWNTLAEVVI